MTPQRDTFAVAPMRSGGWNSHDPSRVRVAFCGGCTSSVPYNDTGFRCALTLRRALCPTP